METVTGFRPPTCPWRTFYNPLVIEVRQIVDQIDNGIGSVALGNDPPAILLDGVAAYLRARNLTKSYDYEQEEKQRKAKEAASRGRQR